MTRIINRIAAWLHGLPVARYVSLHLIFGLALSIACLWLFLQIAAHVRDEPLVVAFDQALADAFYAQATPVRVALYRAVTWFGGQGLIAVAVVVGLLFIPRRYWRQLVIWGAGMGGAALLNSLLKAYYVRPRPSFLQPLVIEQNYSFPSGHAMTAIVVYGLLAYFVWADLKSPTARILVVFAATMLIVLIGISRLALGVHFFSDVVGGYAAGGVWLGFCVTAADVLVPRRAVPPDTPEIAAP